MGVAGGMLAGAGMTLGVVMVGGAVWGGIVGAAPCHSAPDFATGACFGGAMVTMILGLPALLVGSCLGAAWAGWARKPAVPRRGAGMTIGTWMAVIAIFGVMLALYQWINQSMGG